MNSSNFYDSKADDCFAQYQALSFSQVHRDWLDLLPTNAGLALDVGAGSGRDSAALAALGWDVVAVEPADGLRNLGKDHTQGLTVHWINDSLPQLTEVRTLSQTYDLILLSAVWMHLPESCRERAFRVLANLLAPKGVLAITLRHGPSTDERIFHSVSVAELELYAKQQALKPLRISRSDDALRREQVSWETVVFQLHDDGTGALPIVRHIIVNDSKSATYKLALLRCITLIAETLPGLVIRRSDSQVVLPLGAVALLWLQLYLPLLAKHNIRQNSQGAHGFAKTAFFELSKFSAYDLQIGSHFVGEQAKYVHQALKDSASNILKMPVQYTTLPGTEQTVFAGRMFRSRLLGEYVCLDKDYLSDFGEFVVPSNIWNCLSQYACWIDPALVNEWILVSRSWNKNIAANTIREALELNPPKRCVTTARNIALKLIESKADLRCVWTAGRLTNTNLAIDHCFPWARWRNNDLWNLLPATQKANGSKSDKLPSAPLMGKSKTSITTWWQEGYLNSSMDESFWIQAKAALPFGDQLKDVDSLFDAMCLQRAVLKKNQRIEEWST
ncbi:class I SAM-dependent methyltransferase [Limnobacter sp.]|uniref:class I SAM-dependent methyltransferase n=1 Tax=Limnobacter sp. TaxID=2003368 RepID=UPI0025C4831E|nr:class I SAM-dependent methyltransferase [Limnobacter sp.]